MITQSPENIKTDISRTAIKMEKCFLLSLNLYEKINNCVLLFSVENNCGTLCARLRCCMGGCVWVSMTISQMGMVPLPKKPPSSCPYIETKS